MDMCVMNKCPDCSSDMKPLFGAAWYCPNDCDLVTKKDDTSGPWYAIINVGEDLIIGSKMQGWIGLNFNNVKSSADKKGKIVCRVLPNNIVGKHTSSFPNPTLGYYSGSYDDSIVTILEIYE